MALSIILATDLQPHEADWAAATQQARDVETQVAGILGIAARVRLASLPGYPGEQLPQAGMRVVQESEDAEILVLPAALDFNIWQRETIGQALAEARRHSGVSIYHDDVDLAHPLVVQCFAEIAAAAPQRTGIVLAASGHGDSASRSQSYRLMRLLWEQLGSAHGEVGFVRHAQPFLGTVLEECAARGIEWVVIPQSQWRREHVEYADVILRGHSQFRMAEPPGAHPMLTAWLAQRAVRLWREKRSRDAARAISPKGNDAGPSKWVCGGGHIARITSVGSMREVLSDLLPAETPERVLVKVTWHGYATGTYTDPAALDLLLGALPCPAVILEGHTTSRNLEDAPFDWEKEARANRAWIRQQESEYLRRTGLADVIARHGAQYLNVTEAYWDEAPGDPESFVPQALLDYRGCPLISFAKFKGPTRLAISNLFGLIPEPLRSAWHGPNITYFARVCCDMARLYGALFPMYGINEALFSAVRWNRQGLYRSRWGNYDLIGNTGVLTASRGLVAADILASRLQGQAVERSAFFDVAKASLEWDAAAAEAPLPTDIQALFA